MPGLSLIPIEYGFQLCHYLPLPFVHAAGLAGFRLALRLLSVHYLDADAASLHAVHLVLHVFLQHQVARHGDAALAVKDAKPDFQILFYPVITMDPAYTHKGSHDNLLGKDAKKKTEDKYSSDMQVTRVTPRAFIALSDDDHAVVPANGVNYYVECYRHDVPASLHVYPSGGHGWGIRDSFKYHIEMELELRAWLQSF